MNKTKIEWVKNPDGTPGYTWNPITGCLNGCEYCYARKLANTRLRHIYMADKNSDKFMTVEPHSPLNMPEPFVPRFWEDRNKKMALYTGVGKGIFVCDMSDLFGIGIPEDWTRTVLTTIRWNQYNRFYLLTKQPQNLIKFSPFPDNCWVGVSATNAQMFIDAGNALEGITAKVKYISVEPLLSWNLGGSGFIATMLQKWGINWVIIGAQTPFSVKTFPKWKWVAEIINACDKANIPVFLKNNLGLPKLSEIGATPYYKKHQSGTMELRQEFPE